MEKSLLLGLVPGQLLVLEILPVLIFLGLNEGGEVCPPDQKLPALVGLPGGDEVVKLLE